MAKKQIVPGGWRRLLDLGQSLELRHGDATIRIMLAEVRTPNGQTPRAMLKVFAPRDVEIVRAEQTEAS